MDAQRHFLQVHYFLQWMLVHFHIVVSAARRRRDIKILLHLLAPVGKRLM